MYNRRIKVSIKRLFTTNNFTVSSVLLMVIKITPDINANIVFSF